MSQKLWINFTCRQITRHLSTYIRLCQMGVVSLYLISLSFSSMGYASIIPWTSAELLPSSNLPCQDNTKPASFHQTASFEMENASLFLAASWIAHRLSESDRTRQLRSWGFNRARDLPKDESGARGYIADHGDYLLIVFRGSESATDYKSNSAFYQSPAPDYLKVPGGWIHDGMKATYNRFREVLLTSYQAFGGKDKPIYITGHSLGGSLAVLAALDFANQGANIGSIYTFGQPKIGNPAFGNRIQTLFKESFHRINVESDITPRVPPAKESAHAFSKILSIKHPKLRKAVEDTFTTLNYTLESGFSQVLTKDGKISPIGSRELEFEDTYWNKISSILYDQTDIQVALQYIASRFLDHDPKVYVCALAKHFQN